MEPQTNTKSAQTFFTKIMWHPLFGIVIGAAIAAYFYFAGIKAPNLTYYVSPTRTAIVQTNKLNNFDVTLNGMHVKGELSSAEIQIWNEGEAPIHHDDILKAICLKTQNGEPILQTTAKTTRDVIGFRLIDSTNNLSVLPMDWKVLEHNDGIKLQVIYGGDVNVQFALDGIIEGQAKGITKYTITDINQSGHFWQWAILYAITYSSFSLLMKRVPPKYIEWIGKRYSGDFLCAFLSIILVGIINNIFIKPGHGFHPMPPFGL